MTPPLTPEEKWANLKTKLTESRKWSRFLERRLAATKAELEVAKIQINYLVEELSKRDD